MYRKIVLFLSFPIQFTTCGKSLVKCLFNFSSVWQDLTTSNQIAEWCHVIQVSLKKIAMLHCALRSSLLVGELGTKTSIALGLHCQDGFLRYMVQLVVHRDLQIPIALHLGRLKDEVSSKKGESARVCLTAFL